MLINSCEYSNDKGSNADLSCNNSQISNTHPIRSISFENVYKEIIALIDKGLVERYLHESSGLEVFSYITRGKQKRSELEYICRGLVLHPPTKTVVTNSFVNSINPMKVI